MDIFLFNTTDQGGGAEKDVMNLCQSFNSRGYKSHLYVGKKSTSYVNAFEIPDVPPSQKLWVKTIWSLREKLLPYVGLIPGAGSARFYLRAISDWQAFQQRLAGLEDFDYPGVYDVVGDISQNLNIFHFHNLHNGYFDLRVLPNLANYGPLFLSLHDQWLLTGHCAYSFSCERWKNGCGNCPDLSIYPAIKRDATSENWLRKMEILNQTKLFISTPSRWLMNQVEESYLESAVLETRIIPYGVNLEIFKPTAKQKARKLLKIEPETKVLLFVANRVKKNIFKDYQTLYDAVQRISIQLKDDRLVFISLGDTGPSEHINRAEIRFIPYQRDPEVVAAYYQAADLYLHAARADNFPITVLESLACGTPVIATAVGGIPEQVHHGRTGFLSQAGDPEGIAEFAVQLLQDKENLSHMSEQAAKDARLRFDLNREVEEFLSWYREAREQFNVLHKHSGK